MSYSRPVFSSVEECCVRCRYQGQWQVITSICGVWLLASVLDTWFWHNTTQFTVHQLGCFCFPGLYWTHVFIDADHYPVSTNKEVNASHQLMEPLITSCMITVWHGNTFCITGNSPFTSGFPLKRTSNRDIWWFILCLYERFVEQTFGLPVIWDAMTFMWHKFNDIVDCATVSVVLEKPHFKIYCLMVHEQSFYLNQYWQTYMPIRPLECIVRKCHF